MGKFDASEAIIALSLVTTSTTMALEGPATTATTGTGPAVTGTYGLTAESVEYV